MFAKITKLAEMYDVDEERRLFLPNPRRYSSRNAPMNKKSRIKGMTTYATPELSTPIRQALTMDSTSATQNTQMAVISSTLPRSNVFPGGSGSSAACGRASRAAATRNPSLFAFFSTAVSSFALGAGRLLASLAEEVEPALFSFVSLFGADISGAAFTDFGCSGCCGGTGCSSGS